MNFVKELNEADIVEFQWVSLANNAADLLTKNRLGKNTISMLQDCVGIKNTKAMHKMERVMIRGGCQ